MDWAFAKFFISGRVEGNHGIAIVTDWAVSQPPNSWRYRMLEGISRAS